ncbi:MAG: acyl-CoA dehydrogenase family protein [Planctomycetota bacterium]
MADALRTHLDLTDEQEMIRDTVREFAADQLRGSAHERDEKQQFPAEPLAALAELGMLGVAFPEAVGGADGDVLSLMIALEELAHACGSTALTIGAHIANCGWPIFALGNDEQKQAHLPAICSGEVLGALAVADPVAGTGIDGGPLVATRDGDNWVLNGTKIQVVNAGEAGKLVAIAHQGAADGPLAAFVLDTTTAGVDRSDRLATLGMRAADMRHVAFRGVKLPASACLSTDAVAVEAALDVPRLALAAIALGLGRAALDQATEYCKARKQFDTPIVKFAAVADRVAAIATRSEAARHLLVHAARLADAGRPFAREARIAKIVASEAAVQSTFDAIQVFGGNGYSREYPVERMWRDARFTSLAGSTNEQLRDGLVNELVGEFPA